MLVLWVGMNEAVLIGKDDGLHAVPQVQFREDASDVRLHCGLRDDEFVGNLRVRLALRKQVEHLQFTSSEQFESRRRLGVGGLTRLRLPRRRIR